MLWYLQFMKRAYDIFILYTLYHINSKNNLDLLKVDLYNEGVERKKDVLGRYQNSGFNIYAIEISKKFCFMARPNFPEAYITQGSIEKLPFTKNSFDIILDLSTLDHIPEKKALEVIIDYKRILRKGGFLLIIFRYNSMHNMKIKNAPSYFFSNSFIEKIKKDFESTEEYSIGMSLAFSKLFNKLPKQLSLLIINLELYIEQRIKKLQQLRAFYVIIARKH